MLSALWDSGSWRAITCSGKSTLVLCFWSPKVHLSWTRLSSMLTSSAFLVAAPTQRGPSGPQRQSPRQVSCPNWTTPTTQVRRCRYLAHLQLQFFFFLKPLPKVMYRFFFKYLKIKKVKLHKRLTEVLHTARRGLDYVFQAANKCAIVFSGSCWDVLSQTTMPVSVCCLLWIQFLHVWECYLCMLYWKFNSYVTYKSFQLSVENNIHPRCPQQQSKWHQSDNFKAVLACCKLLFFCDVCCRFTR